MQTDRQKKKGGKHWVGAPLAPVILITDCTWYENFSKSITSSRKAKKKGYSTTRTDL